MLQLLDVVALGSTLKLERAAKQPDASGYIVEVYAGNRPSRLTVWRHPADESVMAFEFVLKDNMVRAAAGQRPGRWQRAAARGMDRHPEAVRQRGDQRLLTRRQQAGVGGQIAAIDEVQRRVVGRLQRRRQQQ